ncbi:MAG: transglutaminase-like domain-containing protein [Acidobacteriota bacterium]
MPRTLANQLFKEMVARPDSRIDLATAALMIALDEYPSLNLGRYLSVLAFMAGQIRSSLTHSAEARPLDTIEKINEFLFGTQGFRGNVENYYDPRNSFLNEVLDRRTGIPITLSVIYIEVGKRLGLQLEGIGLPGHFVVQCRCPNLEVFIDPFNQGAILFEEECKHLVEKVRGDAGEFDSSFLKPVTNRQILIRMLTNLKAIYVRRQDFERTLLVLDKLLLVNPASSLVFRDRAAVHYHLNHLSLAARDWAEYLRLQPDAEDADTVRHNIRLVGQMLSLRN